MLIVRANPRGGHPLKQNHFPLHEDKDGNFGYLIGYNKDGDKLLVPISLAREIGLQFGGSTSAFNTMMTKIKPKRSFKEWLFTTLYGKKELREMKEEYEVGD